MILLSHIAVAVLALAAFYGTVLLIWHARMSTKRHRRFKQVWEQSGARAKEDIYWNLYRNHLHQKALGFAIHRHSSKLWELIND